MLELIAADAPHPELADRLALFAPLIGRWTLVVEEFSPAGAVTTTDGEWEFSWALDGRAVVDTFVSPSRAARAAGADGGEWGVSVRFPDPGAAGWRSTWIGPRRGWVIPFAAGPADPGSGDDIVLAGERDGVRLRWIFSELAPASFRWRAEETPAGGRPWIRQRFTATRTH
jgi:hypothetical protein